ncbi:hypothetical protein SOVF_158680 isoform B [Spinacia oleracea]|uniref:Uncharacterized protein isoform X2 n=1 Tax=Spinacia oleracea TaxID=3562 RepID=A0A9R0KA65_SPIOL|nr:uncharacterized protein LOC110802175 isoform X2 [Spinacia oleracea]KNA08887.1 hypothetical protein SOVF_158680 isoform B [Spinacia oleracea]
MNDSKSFPPAFSFSSSSTLSSSSSPGMGKFTFCAGTIANDQTTERRRPKTYQAKPVTADSGHSKSASASASASASDSSSSFSFKCPPIFENANAKENSNETKHDNGIRENPKTRFTGLSALTGTIPCCFEGSSYSFQPLGQSFYATEESIKKEDDNHVQNPSASQIMVSRLLKGIPQSPHFWPLRGYSEAAKQSLINAWDRIYKDAVDQIQSMSVNGFWIDAKRFWETTLELQMMGYNVIPLRRRFVELSEVLKKRTRHRIERGRLKSKAEQHMMEKKKLEFEIVKLNARVEAEKASFDDIMAKVAKMDDEMPSFNASFSKLAIKPL